MNPLVRVNGVHKYFTRGNERIDVLQGVNLDIPQGDFLALMGPSGSGKTTLLNLMGGLDKPSAGSLEVSGVNIASLPGGQLSRWRSQHIGFVFQLYNLLPVLTAEKNVELPLLLTKLSRAERRKRLAIALKVVGLKALSGIAAHTKETREPVRVVAAHGPLGNPPRETFGAAA